MLYFATPIITLQQWRFQIFKGNSADYCYGYGVLENGIRQKRYYNGSHI